MFAKNNSTISRSSGDVTFIATECQITGSITIKGNARIDGQIDGTVSASGDLIIGSSAKIKASIEAKNISVAGEVRGNVKTTDTLELSATARLHGDIMTKQLKIEEGARFIGTSQLLDETSIESKTSSSDKHQEKYDIKHVHHEKKRAHE